VSSGGFFQAPGFRVSMTEEPERKEGRERKGLRKAFHRSAPLLRDFAAGMTSRGAFLNQQQNQGGEGTIDLFSVDLSS